MQSLQFNLDMIWLKMVIIVEGGGNLLKHDIDYVWLCGQASSNEFFVSTYERALVQVEMYMESNLVCLTHMDW